VRSGAEGLRSLRAGSGILLCTPSPRSGRGGLQNQNLLDHARPVGIEIGGHIELVEPTSHGGHLWLQRRLTGRLFCRGTRKRDRHLPGIVMGQGKRRGLWTFETLLPDHRWLFHYRLLRGDGRLYAAVCVNSAARPIA